MKKIFNRKNLFYFLAFIIPVVLVLGYITYQELMRNFNFFKHGQNFLVADMQVQYNFLYSYIHNILSGKDSILFSFYSDLGENMFSTIGYYLSSPFNILYGLVSKADIPVMTTIIHMLKLGLCSLFMNIYLNHKFGNKGTNLIFSITYAFIGFNAVYYFNAMWTDVIYMTPLVMLGIDKLIKGKPLIYVITLSLSIIFNFYIAYMLCIFCVIYFIYELLIEYKLKDFKKYKKIILRFIISSILAFTLSAFFTLPLIINMKSMNRFPLDKSGLIFSISSIYKNLFYKVFTNTYLGISNYYNNGIMERSIIYVSLFSFVLSILYFFNKKIKLKERMLSLVIVVFMLFSFVIPHLQLLWQAFSFPNGYIDRFSFLYSFFIILLGAKQFYSKENPKVIKLIIFIIIYSIVTSLIIFKNIPYLKNINLIVSIFLVIIYVIFYKLKFKLKKKDLKELYFILLLIISFEVIYNYSEVKILLEDWNMTGTSIYRPFANEVCNNFNNLDMDYYRIEGDRKASNLDSHLCNYHTISNEVSTKNSKVYDFMYRNSSNVNHVAIKYDPWKLPILDSLLGIKYIYSECNLNKYFDYEEYRATASISYSYPGAKLCSYKNPYSLSLGYAISDDFDKNYRKDNGSRLDNLNNLIKSLSGITENVLVEIPKQKDEKGEYYYIDKDVDRIYFTEDYVLSKTYTKHADLKISNNTKFSINDNSVGTNILKNIEKDSKLRIQIINNKDITGLYLYYFDYDSFKKAINILKQNQLENVKTNGNKLSAEINLDNDATVMITIPYDKGWKVYVDGKKVKYREIADTFIGINIPKGKHKITMKFYPRGLFIGIGVTSLSILLLVLYLKKSKIKVEI